MAPDAEVIVVGAGLAGLVATAELADAGRRVLLLEQEPEASLGGQAFWSFGGLFLLDTPEQRRLRVRDCADLALSDWLGSAGFDREEDHWPRRWAEAYVHFAAGEKREWLHGMGVRWFPLVQWAERGGSLATGHGNYVPCFHITWGTGPGLVEPFVRRVREAAARGRVELRFRHRVTGLSTSGGIGADHDLVRCNWPECMGSPPEHLLSGVPDHVDGRLLEIANQAGGRVIGADRMWNYPEGVRNHSPEPARDPHPVRAVATVPGRERSPAARAAVAPVSTPSAPSSTSSAPGISTPGSC